MLRLRPDLVLTNGPGVAVPICYSTLLLKVLLLKNTQVIYIESVCRVKSLSRAGSLIYPISSEFYVQWEALAAQNPKFKYSGCLV